MFPLKVLKAGYQSSESMLTAGREADLARHLAKAIPYWDVLWHGKYYRSEPNDLAASLVALTI